MADNESGGGASWIAFLAGIILVVVIGFGVFAYTGGFNQQDAQLEINVPDVKINPPEIDLPDPPTPDLPPAAEQPAPTTTP